MTSGRVAQDCSDTALGAELRVAVDQPDLAATGEYAIRHRLTKLGGLDPSRQNWQRPD
jgi:hypothetical protein